MQNKIIRKTLAVVLTLTLMLAVFCPAGLASFKVKINSSSAKVYAKPSASAASVKGKVGMKLTCTSYSGSWARVTYNGHTGYIQSKYLNLVNRVTAYTKSAARVYKKASSSSASTKVSIGTTLYVVGFNGSFARVQNKSGSVTGYIKTSSISTNSAYKNFHPSKGGSSSSGKSSGGGSSGSGGGGSTGGTDADDLISIVRGYIGTPYGSNEPSSFNCSSLVRYCYKKIGYSLKADAKSQAADGRFSKITSISDLQKGDILCFDTDFDGTCDHTAISTGGSSFIEASQKAGKVQSNSLTDYYKKAFLWARRVL